MTLATLLQVMVHRLVNVVIQNQCYLIAKSICDSTLNAESAFMWVDPDNSFDGKILSVQSKDSFCFSIAF
jgi:hypothetical protein